MPKILVAVDGSEHALHALERVVERCRAGENVQIHLLNVQIPVDSGHARMFVSQDDVEGYHREEGMAALRSARDLLEREGLPYQHHVVVGHVAQTIAAFAAQQGFDEIVMGTHGRTGLAGLLLGSVAAEVKRVSKLPVTLVPRAA